MALVLREADYKRLTLFTKIAGIFIWAAGSITLVDKGQVALGLGLLLVGTIVTLAPVPMAVMRPDTLDEAERAEAEADGMLTVNE